MSRAMTRAPTVSSGCVSSLTAALPELVRTTPHVAFEVEDLEAELEGKEVLIAPNSPSPGVRVAFIVDNGAPIELMEIDPESLYSATQGDKDGMA